MSALRVVALGLLVFLGPGLALLLRRRLTFGWAGRVVLAFACSYIWLLLLAVLLPLAGATIDHAAIATGLLVTAGLWRAFRAKPDSPALRGDSGAPLGAGGDVTGGATGVVAGVLVLLTAATAFFVEPPVTGEEALDISAIGRFADGLPITLSNASLLPGARAVYLFQPYQLGVGMVARLAHADPLVTLVSIRPLLVFLCLSGLFALLQRLTRDRVTAFAAFAVVLACICLDLTTWEMRSLYPFVRRGGFMAGVCVPALLTLLVEATTAVRVDDDRRRRTWAAGAACGLLLASLCTHPLEVFTVLVFFAARLVSLAVGIPASTDWRRIAGLVAGLAAVAGGFLVIHDRAVADVSAYEAELKQPARAALTRLAATPAALVNGPLIDESEDLLGGDLPESTTAVLGPLVLPLAAIVAPEATAVLALAFAPLLLLYATPGGFLLLSIVTSPDTVQDVTSYFALLGLLALALGLTGLARAVIAGLATRRPGSAGIAVMLGGSTLVAVLWWRMTPPVAQTALRWSASQPRGLAVAVAALALVAFAASWFGRTRAVRPLAAGGGWTVAVLALVMAIPLSGLGLSASERESLPARITQVREAPAVSDWSAYYPSLSASIRPPLTMPQAVFDELRTRLPPRQVLLADPRESCTLAMLLDAYCINPTAIYGHFFLGARSYLLHETHSMEGQEDDWHPFFNATWPVEDSERTVLSRYGVQYLLADPAHSALILRKLNALGTPASVEMQKQGYVLYHLTR